MSENLNEKQRQAYEMIQNGDNVCIIGKGGSGKSYICELIRNERVLFVGPTGMAALNIGSHARTIHSTLMLGAKSLKAWSWENISPFIGQNIVKLKDFFDKYDMIVFDESSMIISGLFDTYVKLFYSIYGGNSNTLFNNKQIIMILDPLQLTPVKNTSEPYLDLNNYNKQNKLLKSDLIIENEKFKTLFNHTNIIHLTQNMRCSDEEWDKVLQGCRTGFRDCREGEKGELLRQLNERVFTYGQIMSNPELKDKYENSLLTTLKRDKISELNDKKVQELINVGNDNYIIRREPMIEKEEFYNKHVSNFPNKEKSNKTLDNSINYMDDLGGYHSERVYVAGKCTGFNYDFKIVEGGRVMYRKNEEIIRNGSLGTIVKINLDPERKVETIDIKFDRVDDIISIKPVMFEHPDWTDIKIRAFPIISAFAITIHKLQAQTIESPLSILYRPEQIPYYDKQEHLLYTAISRCKRKEDVFIICDCEITEEFFPVNQYMYDWYIQNRD
jgi:hypothetical protein